MGITCPACGTENRSIAKFCIECIAALPAPFPPTQIQPRLSDTSASAVVSRPAAFAGPPAAPPAAPSTQPAAMPRRIAEPRKGLWVSVAAFGIALAIGAAGWMVAGAGGLYIYSSAKPEPTPDAQAAAAASPAAPLAGAALAASAPSAGPIAPIAPVANVSRALPLSSTEIITELAGDVPGSRAAPTVVSTAPPSLPSPEAVARAQAASAARSRPKAVASSAPRAPATSLAQSPQAQCDGLGFFARARCVAAECLKPAYRPHAQCEAVRQQQQLMEEKRNPSGGGG